MRRAILCALGGVIASVLVAWWCALSPGLVMAPTPTERKRAEVWSWPCRVPAEFPKQPDQLWFPHASGLNVLWARAFQQGARDEMGWEGSTLFNCMLFRSGWPCRSMEYLLTLEIAARGTLVDSEYDEPRSAWEGGIEAPGVLLRAINRDGSLWRFARRLPVRPAPLGFAVDTLLYSGVGWFALLGLSAMRGWHRRRRNQCRECGYDLRGLGAAVPCPECGCPGRLTGPG